jgi:NAD(P)-dependent dehydrogenase (short-subunit alcohol dehydrogenase family)
MLDTVLQRWGRLDCLVNNAGTAAKQRGDLLEVTPDNYQYCTSTPGQCSSFAKKRRAPCFRRVSLIISTALLSTSLPVAPTAYRFLAGILRIESSRQHGDATFALRLAEEGIGVYEIRPGIIETDMTSGVKPKYDQLIGGGLVPMKRWGQPTDTAVGRRCAGKRLTFHCRPNY